MNSIDIKFFSDFQTLRKYYLCVRVFKPLNTIRSSLPIPEQHTDTQTSPIHACRSKCIKSTAKEK